MENQQPFQSRRATPRVEVGAFTPSGPGLRNVLAVLPQSAPALPSVPVIETPVRLAASSMPRSYDDWVGRRFIPSAS